jgi:hypothetical protein
MISLNDLGFAAGLAGLAAAMCGLALLWWVRSDLQRETESVRGEIAGALAQGVRQQETIVAARIAELKRDLTDLELSMQSTRELLGDGRLNRSSRAGALSLLRSGVTPDTAASTLSMARHEVRLLARVVQILTSR